MKLRILLVTLVSIALSSTAFSHSGRTDKNGGHNCSEQSKKKGLCTGYHYHASEAIELDQPIAFDKSQKTDKSNQEKVKVVSETAVGS